MRVQSLEAFGVHPDLLRAWAENYSEELLPVQAQAVSEGEVLSGNSLVVYAPTGAGKTFVGEMAAMHATTAGRRTVYLVPTKALAEEKYVLFTHLYGTLGLRIVISTRDRRAADRRVSRGQFDLLITVPEKLRFLLSCAPGVARHLGCLVVDELQLLGDETRGPCLETALAQIKSRGALQIVGLSAVIDQPQPLADWLGGRAIAVHERPVELRKGVVAEGTFRYLEHNSGQVGEEELLWGTDIADCDFGEAVVALACRLTARGEPTMLFLKDKRNSARLSYRLAESTDLPPAQQTSARLAALPPTSTRRCLLELLQHGVAFHNADLQFADRQAIEAGMAQGEIGALCCTSTLAMGVNLPARNVIVETHCWENSSGRTRPAVRPITRAEFENMGGRAGRLRFGDAFGRAILLADTEFVREMMFQRYVTGPFEPLQPALARRPRLSQLLTLCSVGPHAEEHDLARLYRHTFTAHLRGQADSEKLPPELREAYPATLEYGLLHKSALTGELAVTPQGRLCSGTGLSLSSFRWLSLWVAGDGKQPGAGTPLDDLALLLVASLAPEAQTLIFAPRAGDRDEDLRAALREVAAERAGDAVALAAIMQHPDLDSYQAARGARLALALLDWTGPDPTIDIEQRWQIPAGRLQGAAETVAWLMHTAVGLGEYAGWSAAACQRLRVFAEQVGAGVAEEGLTLYRTARCRLDRDQVQNLLSAGIINWQQAQQLPPEQRAELLGTADLPELEADDPPRLPPVPPVVASKAEPTSPLLEIDQTRPDRVIFRCQEVYLRPAEHKLLVALANRPQECVPYNAIYNHIWGPDEIVEPAQIHWHRSQLVKKLRAVAGEAGDDAVPIRTLPRRGYMLDIDPQQVKVT